MDLDAKQYVGKTLNGWTIEKHLGGGGFGHVFAVTRKGSGPKYAMKLVRKAEVTKTGKVKKSQGVEASALAMEYRIYTTRLRQMQAVPKLAQAAPYGNANPGTKPSDEVRYMVMEMCNRTLTEVLDKNPEGLPFGDIAQAALHVLSVLKELHEKGFVYVDIKTDNIMIGSPQSEHQVANANGTAMYISAFAHAGEAPHPRNDLQSLGFLMAYLANGSLPWQFEPSQAKLIERKLACSTAEVSGSAPAALKQWLDIVYALPLGDPALIPYEKLERLLEKHAPASGKFSPVMLGADSSAAPTAAAAAAGRGGARKSTPKASSKRAAQKKKPSPKKISRPVIDLNVTTSDESGDSSSKSSSSDSDASPVRTSRRTQAAAAKRGTKRSRAAPARRKAAASAQQSDESDASDLSPPPKKQPPPRRTSRRTRAAARAAAAAVSSSASSSATEDSDSSVSSISTDDEGGISPQSGGGGSAPASAASSPRSVVAGVIDDLPERGRRLRKRAPMTAAPSTPSSKAGVGGASLARGSQGVQTPGAVKLPSTPRTEAEPRSAVCGRMQTAVVGMCCGSLLAVGMAASRPSLWMSGSE